MGRLLALAAVLGLLALAGCGDDDEPTPDGATGATGAQDAATAGGLTAKEFIDASIPDQVEEVQRLAGENPDCSDVDAKPGGDFQVAVAINAAQASPETSLAEIVADACAG
jgi:hypothetical protein